MFSLFNSILSLSGYDIYKARKFLGFLKNLSSDEFIAWQDKKKWEIAKFHYTNNDRYRKKVGRFFPDAWNDLPIMEKADYQDDLSLLLSKGYSTSNTYIANTSGSSGHPFFFAKDKYSHA